MISELAEKDFPKTHAFLRAGVAEGVAPGFVAGVWNSREPSRYRVTAYGHRSLDPVHLPMLPDTVFDIASVSKVFATASLAGVLVERGWLSWTTPFSAIFPEYPWRDITIEHLLSHTAGLNWWEPYYERLQARFAPSPIHEISIERRQRAMKEWVFATAPKSRPGEKAEYSDLSFILLGFALEKITSMRLDRAVETFLWAPMNLLDDRGPEYRPTRQSAAERDETVAATELSPWHRTILQGQVHDENCWAMGGIAGHAGVFATAEHLLKFSHRLLTGFLNRETLKEMWTRMPEPAGCSRTRGWDTPSEEGSLVGRHFLPGSIGHWGFAGTSLWLDPRAGVAVTLLSNRIHPSRENVKIRSFRPQFHDAIREDLSALHR